ncbi:MAG: SCO family protein [Bacteroidia bacterium]
MNRYFLFLVTTCASLLMACGNSGPQTSSDWETELRVLEAPATGDAYQLPDFSFVDQDSNIVTQESIKGKVVVSDFFFTSCPSICPVMTKQMYRLYEQFKDDDRVVFLSHTINPKYDSVPVLKAYANKLGEIDSKHWHFLHGELEDVEKMAVAYFEISPVPDPEVPGNILHDGSFHLIDQQGRLRLRPRTLKLADGSQYMEKSYKGNDPSSVDKLAEDIRLLLKN